MNDGRHDEAAALYQRASELAPDNHELRFWAGLGAAQAGDLDERRRAGAGGDRAAAELARAAGAAPGRGGAGGAGRARAAARHAEPVPPLRFRADAGADHPGPRRARPARVRGAPVPAARRDAVGPAAQARALPVPDRRLNAVLQARRGRVLPGPARRPRGGPDHAPRSTTPSTSSTRTAGGTSASSSSRTTRRSCAGCSTPPPAGCASAAASGWSGRWTSSHERRERVLIEGFEREPLIRQPWHPPYYQQRCRGRPG